MSKAEHKNGSDLLGCLGPGDFLREPRGWRPALSNRRIGRNRRTVFYVCCLFVFCLRYSDGDEIHFILAMGRFYIGSSLFIT